MMRRLSLFTIFMLWLPLLHAGYENGGVISDYADYVETFSGLLQVIDNGSAERIDIRNSASIEVWSTTPLGWLGGIWDIVLYDSSHLDYYGGETDEIMIREDATAILKGGSINGITSMQRTTSVGADPHITLYCQKDSWSWIDGNRMLGIQGLWLDGTPFYIEFQNHSNYDPVYTNINIMPEPATFALLAAGGLLLRRRKH